MEKEFVEKMKEKLLEQKEEIIDKLNSASTSFNQLMDGGDSKDEVDVASDEIDRKLLEAIGVQDMNRMKSIDNALTRIELGKYGNCLRCGKPITKERLTAIPYAAFCLECQALSERS